jgi:5'-3' exonuclease
VIETALIDGDLVAFRVAASTENETEDIAIWRTSEFMERLLYETNAMGHKCFLSGDNNFRYGINPDYKANRKDLVKPKWLQAIREHLVTVWNASVTDGYEADDAMGIQQVAANGDTCIVSLDKDMLMIPGQHYSWEISGTSTLGKQWTRPAEFRQVSPFQGLLHFYKQLLIGDKADNIIGVKGIGPVKAEQALEGCTDEWELFSTVRDMYCDDDRLLMNGRCLWIWQKEDNLWNFPIERMDGSPA